MSTTAIVVGIDGSGSALEAARWAAAEATRRHRPLRLLHAYEIPVGYAPGVVAPEMVRASMRREGQRYLRDAAAVVAEVNPELDPELVVEHGGAAQRLIESPATLIVLGSRGLGGFSGLLVGSTAVAVAAQARCPAVTVRGTTHPDGPVVIGVSGSPEGERAISFAFDEAATRGCELIAVHAWADSVLEVLRSGGMTAWDFAPAELRAAEVLAERLAGWAEKYPEVAVTRVVDHAQPTQALLDRAESAALLVVGSRGRGALRGVLLGSTSQQLLYHAPCPVAVVRPDR